MSRQESKRQGRPETLVLKGALPVEEAVPRMVDFRRPRRKRKGTVSKSGEEDRGGHQDEARTAGTHGHWPR